MSPPPLSLLPPPLPSSQLRGGLLSAAAASDSALPLSPPSLQSRGGLLSAASFDSPAHPPFRSSTSDVAQSRKTAALPEVARTVAPLGGGERRVEGAEAAGTIQSEVATVCVATCTGVAGDNTVGAASRAVSGGCQSDRNSTREQLSKRRMRSAAFAQSRELQQSAGRVLLTVSPTTWAVLSFLQLLRRRRFDSRARVAKLLKSPPVPLHYDVGYDAKLETFTFRSAAGVISSSHPSTSLPCTSAIPAYDANGRTMQPLQPPITSSFVLMPEASGAWCYYDTAHGHVQWFAPPDSTTPTTRTFATPPEPFNSPPPRLPSQLAFETLEKNSQWMPIYEDCEHRVLFYHRLTGSIRIAPWLALRTVDGCVCFANMVTRETRWFPPHLWMEGWISRPSLPLTLDEFTGTVYARSRLPVSVARKRVEGGAPYFHDSGRPPYDPDDTDSKLTYPFDSSRC